MASQRSSNAGNRQESKGGLNAQVVLACCLRPCHVPLCCRAGAERASQSVRYTNKSNDHLCLPSRFGEQSDRSGVFQQDCTEPAVAIHGRLRGIDVYPTIPVRILDNLALDGLAPADIPHELTSDEANGASRVLAFDRVPPEQRGDAQVTFGLMSPLELTIMTPHATRSWNGSRTCFAPLQKTNFRRRGEP
jgi:hypothetical protein